MGIPFFAVTALARSRTARQIVKVALTAIAILAVLALAPLAMIPLALAGYAAPPPDTDPSGPGPTVVGEWGYPLAGDYTKGRGFGHNPVDGCSYCSVDHEGYDMAQGCGSTIHAAGPGKILSAGPLYGWGNTVRIDHGGGLVTLYGHMEWNSIHVVEGALVVAGTALGAEGNTGNSFGCHLHYEVQVDGVAIDPEPFMAELGLPLK